MDSLSGFPKDVLDSKPFEVEFRRLFEADDSYLRKMFERLPRTTQQLRIDEFVDEASAYVGLSGKDFRVRASFLKAFSGSATSCEESLREVVDKLVKKFGIEAPQARLELIENLVSKEAEKFASERELDAFAFGVTFQGCEVQPLIVPARTEGGQVFHFGVNVSLTCLDASSEVTSISFNMSRHELRDLIQTLAEAEKNLETISKSIPGGSNDSR